MDEKHYEARAKLEKLLKYAWYLRNGGYHFTHLPALREEARSILEKERPAASCCHNGGHSNIRETNPAPILRSFSPPDEIQGRPSSFLSLNGLVTHCTVS